MEVPKSIIGTIDESVNLRINSRLESDKRVEEELMTHTRVRSHTETPPVWINYHSGGAEQLASWLS